MTNYIKHKNGAADQRLAEEARPWTFLFTDDSTTVVTVVDKVVFRRLTFAPITAYKKSPVNTNNRERKNNQYL